MPGTRANVKNGNQYEALKQGVTTAQKKAAGRKDGLAAARQHS